MAVARAVAARARAAAARVEVLMAVAVMMAEGADEMSARRSGMEGWVGDSFHTISSSGANAAVIHYHAEHSNCKPIDVNAVYLCDTGGQYVDGTTDTTRTLCFGSYVPSEDAPAARG